MHWKVKKFILLYQNAAIPTHIRDHHRFIYLVWFQSQGWRCGRYLLWALAPFRAAASAGCVPRAPIHFPRSRRVSGAARARWVPLAVTCPSLLRVAPATAAPQSGLRPRHSQRGGMRAGMPRRRKSSPFHKTWFKKHRTSPGPSPEPEAEAFQSPEPLKSYTLPSGNAWCMEASSLPISADSSKNPTPVQKAELLRAGEWKMPENFFYSLGMANACIHLGSREKPSFSPWFLLPFPICHLLHPSWLPLTLGWDHLPETRNLEQGCLQAGLPSPFRSTPFIQQKIGSSFCKHIHTCMWLTQYKDIPPERSSAVTVSSLWFTSEGLSSQLQGESSCLFSATPLLWQQQVVHLKRGGVV